jgi:ribose transport system substrate-binding protein
MESQRIGRRGFLGAVAGASLLSACSAGTTGGEAGQKTLGIVALVATDALNAAVIRGATDLAEENGWRVVVTDTQGSPDKANAAMTTFSTTQKTDAILVSAFASSSIGAGLASAKSAGVPVVSWGGELVDGIIATTSARKVGEDSVAAMLDDFGTTGEVLALTYHTGVLCLYRGMAFDDALATEKGITVTANEVAIPGQVEDGTNFTAAWLASRPAGAGNYAIWGAWDEPGMGAVAALKQAGRTDVKVYAINGAPNALEAVRDGSMRQVVWQDGVTEGTELMQAVLDAAGATSAEPSTIDVPGVVVDGSTVEAFLTEHPEALT